MNGHSFEYSSNLKTSKSRLKVPLNDFVESLPIWLNEVNSLFDYNQIELFKKVLKSSK